MQPTKLTTAQECAEMRRQIEGWPDPWGQPKSYVLALLDSYERAMAALHFHMGDRIRLVDCRKVAYCDTNEQCTCGGNLVWLIDGAKLDAPEPQRCVPDGLMARCRVCGQTWTFVDERPICKGAPKPASPVTAEPTKPRRMMAANPFPATPIMHQKVHEWRPQCDQMDPLIRCQPLPVQPTPAERRLYTFIVTAVEDGEGNINYGGEYFKTKRVLPMPDAKALGQAVINDEDPDDPENLAEHVGRAIYRALGVSDGK